MCLVVDWTRRRPAVTVAADRDRQMTVREQLGECNILPRLDIVHGHLPLFLPGQY